MFDKRLNLPSFPFCWKKSNDIITALTAFEGPLGSLSYSHSSSCLSQNVLSLLNCVSESLFIHFLREVFPDLSRESVLPSSQSPSATPLPIDVLWMPLSVPQAALYHFHQGPSSSHALGYLYSYPSPRALVAQHSDNVDRKKTGRQRWRFPHWVSNGPGVLQDTHWPSFLRAFACLFPSPGKLW